MAGAHVVERVKASTGDALAIRRLGPVLAAALVVGVFAPLPAASAEEPPAWEVTLDIAFPTRADARFSDDFDACRSGCARTHQATDVVGGKHWPLFAVVDGHVCRIDEGEEDSYGRHISVCGDDGNTYRYLHMNNDTPGTDDGQAGLEHVYAPGIARGVRVARGQLLGWMGDSGNAENTVDHLHFDVFVPGTVNPWGEERINPYRSLLAARNRGEFPDGSAMPMEVRQRLNGATRVHTAVLLSQEAFNAADHVVVADADAPHDALVAGPLAAVLGGPVLITGDTVDPIVVEEIRRLGATDVTVVGDVAPDLGPLAGVVGADHVTRLDGGNPAATSALVADRIYEMTGAADDVVTELTGAELGFVWDALDREPTLVVTDDRERTGHVALDGARVPRDEDRVYVALAGVGEDTVEEVDFFLDGDYVNTERLWPYDLLGTRDDFLPRSVHVDGLASGDHVVLARVTDHDGVTTEVTATFTIGSEAPVRAAVLALGSHPDPNQAWPDALMASWYGSVRQVPVLLTAPEGLPDPIATLAGTLTSITVAGGPNSIPDAQLDLLAGMAGSVVRRAGSDRYETAAALADDLIRSRDVALTEVFVATGDKWPDAVAAGPAVAREGTLLILVDGLGAKSTHTREFMQRVAEDVVEVTAVGGPDSISDGVLKIMAWWAV
jgi:putative cell wall-binding protein